MTMLWIPGKILNSNLHAYAYDDVIALIEKIAKTEKKTEKNKSRKVEKIEKIKKRNSHTKPHPFFIIFHHLAIRMKKKLNQIFAEMIYRCYPQTHKEIRI